MGTRVGTAPHRSLTAEEHHAWALKLWQRMDRDASDYITKEELACDELQDALRTILAPRGAKSKQGACKRSRKNLQLLVSYCLRNADKNCDDQLSFEEFEFFLRSLRNDTSPNRIATMTFALFDLDHDGYIDEFEFREVFQFFVGRFPTAVEFQIMWDKLREDGKNSATRKDYALWLEHHSPPAFREHAPPVIRGSAEFSGPKADRTPIAKKGPFRVAPGILRPPPMRRSGSEADLVQAWSVLQTDPSEQNLAFRGNYRMRSMFSRPQSLPELHRFYRTYQGFDKNRQKFEAGDPPRNRAVLSDQNWFTMSLPGAERHDPGQCRVDAKGRKSAEWTEGTPRAHVKPIWAPGALLMRMPGPPAPSLVQGRGASADQ